MTPGAGRLLLVDDERLERLEKGWRPVSAEKEGSHSVSRGLRR